MLRSYILSQMRKICLNIHPAVPVDTVVLNASAFLRLEVNPFALNRSGLVIISYREP